MLNTFLAGQAEKEAHLKQQRVVKTKQTHDVAVQCACSRETSDVAVQTDLPDVMEDLKEQVRSLSKIVADLTELKAQEQLPIPLCDLVTTITSLQKHLLKYLLQSMIHLQCTQNSQ